MLEVLKAERGSTAQGTVEALMGGLRRFAGDAPQAQHDDVTVMVLVREPAR